MGGVVLKYIKKITKILKGFFDFATDEEILREWDREHKKQKNIRRSGKKK